MAKIQSQNIVITLSRLVKDTDERTEYTISAEIVSALEQVLQELVETGTVVEVQVE